MFRALPEDERRKGCEGIGQGLSGICSLGLDILQLRSTWKWQKATKRLCSLLTGRALLRQGPWM